MSSLALADWSSLRRQRLDNLVAAHKAVTGGLPGRRSLTEEINHALIVRLASEFQGFCRDLHDEAIQALLRIRLASDPDLRDIVTTVMESGRKLDSGNANWGNVTNDFGRLGCNVATDLRVQYPGHYTGWVEKMERLNQARNAIAHNNREQMRRSESQQPLTLVTFRQWRSALSGVASGLDSVLARYLKQLNRSTPW